MNKDALRYLPSHEWVGIEGDVATVGITDFAVRQLTDLTYVELPKVGASVTQGERFGEVESVKAVSDLYSPVSGEVVDVNSALDDDVAPLSDDPFGAGWLIKVRLSGPGALDGLLDHSAYEKLCGSDSH